MHTGEERPGDKEGTVRQIVDCLRCSQCLMSRNETQRTLLWLPPVRHPHSGDAHRVAVNRGFVIIMGRWDIVYVYDLKVVRKNIKKGEKVITIIPISVAWWDRAFRINDWKWKKKKKKWNPTLKTNADLFMVVVGMYGETTVHFPPWYNLHLNTGE